MMTDNYFDQCLFSYNINTTRFKHVGCENDVNDHQRQNDLIPEHILPTDTLINVWRAMIRICIFIQELKVPLRRKFLFLFSPFSHSNPFNEYVIAKLAIN